jgi:hypothetical protein
MTQSTVEEVVAVAARYSEDPAEIGSLVADWIEEELPHVLARVKLPPPRSPLERRVDAWRLEGKPGWRQYPKRIREEVREKLEMEDTWAVVRQMQARTNELQIAETAATSVGLSGRLSGAGCLVELPFDGTANTEQPEDLSIPITRDSEVLSVVAEEPPAAGASAPSAAELSGANVAAGVCRSEQSLPAPVEQTEPSVPLKPAIEVEEEVLLKLAPVSRRDVEVEITQIGRAKPRFVIDLDEGDT